MRCRPCFSLSHSCVEVVEVAPFCFGMTARRSDELDIAGRHSSASIFRIRGCSSLWKHNCCTRPCAWAKSPCSLRAIVQVRKRGRARDPWRSACFCVVQARDPFPFGKHVLSLSLFKASLVIAKMLDHGTCTGGEASLAVSVALGFRTPLKFRSTPLASSSRRCGVRKLAHLPKHTRRSPHQSIPDGTQPR